LNIAKQKLFLINYRGYQLITNRLLITWFSRGFVESMSRLYLIISNGYAIFSFVFLIGIFMAMSSKSLILINWYSILVKWHMNLLWEKLWLCLMSKTTYLISYRENKNSVSQLMGSEEIDKKRVFIS